MHSAKAVVVTAILVLLGASCGGTTSTPGGATSPNPTASAAAPTSDPAFAEACSKLVPDLHTLASQLGNVVKSPQTFTTATANISHVLTTDVAAVSDPTFKATTSSLNRPGFHADFLMAASPDGEPVRSA